MPQLSPVRTAVIAAAVTSTALGVAWMFRPAPPSAEAWRPSDRPLAVPSDGYVGSDACRSCHGEHYHTWHRSYHRTMTQVASPGTIRGDFDDVWLHSENQSVHLQREGDEFWVELRDPEQLTPAGEPTRIRRQVVQVTGSHHMQTYWYLSAQSRSLTQLPFVYLLDSQQWIPESSSYLGPPPQNESLRPPGVWNYVCLDCHTTAPRPGFQWDNSYGSSGTEVTGMDTYVAEFGISCEACHGPAEKHVAFHSDSSPVEGQSDSHLVVPTELDPVRSSQVCGQCHSVWRFKSQEDFVDWSVHGHRFRPGGELEQSNRWVIRAHSELPEVRELWEQLPPETKMWKDGMIRVTGREYNGLVESPCYQRGQAERKMTCFSCHTMHAAGVEPDQLDAWADDQLKPGMRSNQACTSCHADYDDAQTLVQHTHHAADSTGSSCYNCHMSYTTYGLLKAIRSHAIDSPSVQVSLDTGRPNACNQCHLNQTLRWTADHLSQWFGMEQPKLSADEQSVAAAVLWTLKGDAGQRVLMAWSMGWEAAREASGTDWMIPYLVALLEDPYGAVRLIAQRSLEQQPGFGDFPFDPFAHPSERRLALQQILLRFQQMSAEGQIHVPDRTLLMDATGNVDVANHQRLLRQRDQRPVKLIE